MVIDMQEWFIVIGCILLLTIVLSGYQRMRKNSLRLRANPRQTAALESSEVEQEPYNSELPNGGARVVNTPQDFPAVEPVVAPEPLPSFSAHSEGERGEDEMSGGEASEVIIVHVQAKEKSGFSGQDILQILLACDLRFGEMNFFHRHDEATGKGRIQFSVANMMQPGVFDLDSMAQLTTRGLTFFLSVPGPKDLMAAFESMLQTAETVASTLNGELLDESRSVATKQTQEHIRQRISDLQRQMLAREQS